MILFHVQHLLGSGHVQRVRLVAEELARRGAGVVVVSGGMPVAGLSIRGVEHVQLPPVKSRGTDFSDLLDADGRPATPELFSRRRRMLEDAWHRWRPRVLVFESYPFGRRQFRDEIGALIDLARAATPPPVVASSVRDIVQRRSHERDRESAALVGQWFDRVLVHGDPAVIPFDASFQCTGEITTRIVYTGYVAPVPVARSRVGSDAPVVVAAGGGAAGESLYRAAIEAARRDDSGRPWRVLVGGALDDVEFQRLVKAAGRDATVERNRADFRELIARAAGLVSQAGYNTVADILVTGVPSLLVPFEGVGETEQLQRALAFEALGRCRVLREADLDPQSLLDEVHQLLAAPEPTPPAVDLGGVAKSADFLERSP